MKKEIENASLSYRTLANDFRDSTQPLTNTKAKVAKGSFGPMFGRKSAPAAGKPSSATGDALDDGMEARGLNDGRNGMKQEGSGKQGVYANKQLKRRGRPGENSTSSSRKTVCRGCGQFHNTQTCFYLFPERAPEWFSGNEQVRKAVEQNLRENTSLADEVNRMKKRRQTKYYNSQRRSRIESRLTRTQCRKVQSDLLHMGIQKRSIYRSISAEKLCHT